MKGCLRRNKKPLLFTPAARRKKERKREGKEEKGLEETIRYHTGNTLETNLRTQNTNYKCRLEHSSMVVRRTSRG